MRTARQRIHHARQKEKTIQTFAAEYIDHTQTKQQFEPGIHLS